MQGPPSRMSVIFVNTLRLVVFLTRVRISLCQVNILVPSHPLLPTSIHSRCVCCLWSKVRSPKVAAFLELFMSQQCSHRQLPRSFLQPRMEIGQMAAIADLPFSHRHPCRRPTLGCLVIKIKYTYCVSNIFVQRGRFGLHGHYVLKRCL